VGPLARAPAAGARRWAAWLVGAAILACVPALAAADAQPPAAEPQPENPLPPVQYAFQWLTIEGGAPGMGFTLDDIVIEWDETHPGNQALENSCANLPARPREPGTCAGGSTPGASCVTGVVGGCAGGGTCVSAVGQCAVISTSRMQLFQCNSSFRVTVQDLGADANSAQVETLGINVRADLEPLGEVFLLTETGVHTGIFTGDVPVSSLADGPGVIFVDPETEGTIIASYLDPDCDLDGPNREVSEVGQLGEQEFLDVDGDGALNLGANGVVDSRSFGAFDDDNCFDPETGIDVANAGQADSDTYCAAPDGASDGTFCLSGADCTVTPGFTLCRGDRVGDACDNCPDDYNPDQDDRDGDGVGRVCEIEGEDLDFDGDPDPFDNCPTIFNPEQYDFGAPNYPGIGNNGIGDACDGADDREPFYGIVIDAGPDLRLDTPAGGDDTRGSSSAYAEVIYAGENGKAESLAQGDDIQVLPFLASASCTIGTFLPVGDGVEDGIDNCPGTCNPTQSDADLDGVGDHCDTVDDWDFDLIPDVLDNCPLAYNPAGLIGAQVDRDGDGLGDECDPDSDDDNRDGVPDDLLQVFVPVRCADRLGSLEVIAVTVADAGSGDGDSIADAGESVFLDVTVKNTSVDAAGQPLALHNVVLGLVPQDAAVACVADPTAAYGTIASGEQRANPVSDRFRVVMSQGPEAQTPSLDAIRRTRFEVVAFADEIQGLSPPPSFVLEIDLDAPGGMSGGGPLNGTGELTEGFEGITGTPGLVTSFDRVGATLADVIAVIPATNCRETPLGPPDCSQNVSANDWHLHHLASEPANAPDGGRAHLGTAGLHLARHRHPTQDSQTSYRFRQVSAFMAPPVNIGAVGERRLEFWHIINLADDHAINFKSGEAGDLGYLEVRLDSDPDPGVDQFGPWQRLEPDLNPYDHGRDSLFTSSCKFDPTDDVFDASQGGVPNETICAPRTGWSHEGDKLGSSLDCLDGNGNGVPDCGDATTLGPDYIQHGSVGSGVWVRSGVDLDPFALRRIQIRWVFSSLAFGEPTFLSYLETPGAPGAFDIDEKDDGWYLDDVRLTGLVNTQIGVVPDGGDDPVSGTNVLCGPNLLANTLAAGDDLQALALGSPCAADTDVVILPGPNGVLNSIGSDVCPSTPATYCAAATARLNGGDGATFATGYPGQPFVLDASATTLDACVAGTALYEFAQCATLALADPCAPPGTAVPLEAFSPDARLPVFPREDSRYRVRVRCSSQPEGAGCSDTTDAVVRVYPGDAAGMIQLGEAGVTCSAGDSGSPAACDATDALVFTFAKPAQGSGLGGFSLLRAARSGLATPVVTGATCVVAAFGAAEATGALITQPEAPSFAPASRTAAYYVIAHRATTPGGPAAAGSARPLRTGDGWNGPTSPRLVDPACP